MRRKEGRGGRRDEEEGWTRRKERRGGRSDEETEKMKKWLEDASLTSGSCYVFHHVRIDPILHYPLFTLDLAPLIPSS